MAPISSADLALASARTSSVRLASEIVPAGASRVTLPSAELRSAMVRPWAASASGSTMIWTMRIAVAEDLDVGDAVDGGKPCRR